MSISFFHSNLSALEFDTFCNDYGIGDEYGPELPGPNDTIRDFPQGKIGLSHMWYTHAARPAFYDDDEQEMNLQDFIKAPVIAVPLINTRKRSPPHSSTSGYSKKVKNVESSGSGAHVVGESFTKAH
ncbi:hypothetical protein Tco_1536833, partial [Tanacetum coccineum]